MPEWVEILVNVLSGLGVVIPLVVKLVEYVQKAAKEKNWQALLDLVTGLMKDAESKFTTGQERKEWVLTCVKASADTLNYDIDLDQVGKLVDSLTDMSKIVNAPKKTEEVAAEVAK